MKRIINTIMTLSALALLLASCGKEPMAGKGGSRAIKLTVDGVDTKASVIDSASLHQALKAFKISAYVTESWRRDRIGGSPLIPAGIYVDPGFYEGPYDESTYPSDDNKLKDVTVTYSSSRSEEKWRIAGNEDYDTPAFSWVSGVATNFFAYAPVTVNGTRTISKADNSTDANYPFTYAAKVSGDAVTSATCEDIIFAYTQHVASFEADSSKANYGELVDGSTDKFSLKFYHALAQIRFCVDPEDFPDTKLISAKLVGPKSTSDPTKYVGIATSGSCNFAGATDTFSWSSLANRYSYIQTFNGTSGVSFASGAPTGWGSSTYGTNRTLYTCTGDVLLVIPQILSDCGVEVTIQQTGSSPVLLQGKLPATKSGSTNVSWDAGYYYTYKIGTVGTQEDLSLTMTLVDWAEREHYIPID